LHEPFQGGTLEFEPEFADGLGEDFLEFGSGFLEIAHGGYSVLYQGTRFGTIRRIPYAHSTVGTPNSGDGAEWVDLRQFCYLPLETRELGQHGRPLPFSPRTGSLLLRTKCLHGIDGGGATSGNDGRDQAGDREQSTDGQDCNWVVPADTKEKRLNGARGGPRGNQPGDEPKRKQERGPLEHKHQHVGSLRAESHADTHFARAAADGIGHEAIKTDQREKQCNAREDGQQRGLKAPPRSGLRLQFAHALNVARGEVGVEGVKNGANGGCERLCRKRGADGNVSTIELHVGIIDLRLAGFFQ